MHILAGGSPPPLPGFLNSLSGPLDHYGYWAIALLLLLENIGVPVVPGEFAMIAGAVFAGTGRAGLNIVAVGIVAVAAAFAGAEVGYLIGRFAGRELVLRYGKYVLIKPHHLDRAEAVTSRYGGIAVIIARYIVGLREANGIIAGVTQMRWLTFAIYNLAGACAWVATWVAIGDLAGDHIDTIYRDVNRFSLYLFIVLAVLLAGYLVRLVLRRRRTGPTDHTGRPERTGRAADAAGPGAPEDDAAQDTGIPAEPATPNGPTPARTGEGSRAGTGEGSRARTGEGPRAGAGEGSGAGRGPGTQGSPTS